MCQNYHHRCSEIIEIHCLYCCLKLMVRYWRGLVSYYVSRKLGEWRVYVGIWEFSSAYFASDNVLCR